MNKFLGIIMITLGGLLALAILGELGNIHLLKENGIDYQTGYMAGQIIGAVLMAAVSYFLIRNGIRFSRNKPKENS